MAIEFALESSVDLTSSQETGADNLAWFGEHTGQLGLILGEAAVLVAVMFGIVKGLEALGSRVSKKPAETANA